MEIYTRWRIKIKRCNEEAVWRTHEEKEGHCQPELTQKSSCILARTLSHGTLHQGRRRKSKGGVGGGTIGTAQRSLVTTIDRRTPHGHYGNGVHGLRSHALSWLPEPRCVSRRRRKQQIANNKRTDGEINTHFGFPLANKKLNKTKQNLLKYKIEASGTKFYRKQMSGL